MNTFRIKSLLFVVCIVTSSFFLYNFVDEQMSDASFTQSKEKTLFNLIHQTLREGHYQPRAINDEFSEKAYQLYLRRIDPQKRFFTAGDIAILKPYRDKIDDEFLLQNTSFFDLSIELVENRISQISGWIDEILDEPFDFTHDEWIQLNPDSLDYATDETALKERWVRLLKYQTISRLHNELDAQQKRKESDNEEEEEKSLEEMEIKAREGVATAQNNFIRRMDQMERDDWLTMYVNSLTNVFGPHTAYYPPKDREDFDIGMSGQLEGIGAQLQDRDGDIRVTNVVPGSASYRQGDLEVGDVILKVAQGNEEPVEITGMRLDRAVRLIRGPKGTEVRLTVRKVDGTNQVIPIIRDIVVLEETYARTYIIHEEGNNTKVGYIKLPSFYADFQGRGGRNSAQDVKEAVESLKAENIDGLILDLRNNGGGSLNDVVEIVGLFIENGPVVQVQSRVGNPQILADQSEELLYDGEIIVMVNQFSASASEILAAAIQDYRRGVVVGQGTFGKGTVQRFFDLDRFLSGSGRAFAPLGSVKLTTQKFFRINGGATQLKGAIPDIQLPDNFMHIETGESEHDYPLAWSEIDPVNYTEWHNPPDLNRLIANSKQRVESNETFDLIAQNAVRLKNQNSDRLYPINLDKYIERQKQIKAESERFEAIQTLIEDLLVDNLPGDITSEIESDEAFKERNENWIEQIRKDAYVYESLKIMQEMLR